MADGAGAACREALVAGVKEVSGRVDGGEWGILLSGGVDSAAVLAANAEAGGVIRIRLAVCVAYGTEGSDRAWAEAVAAQHGLELVVVEAGESELDAGITHAVRTLETCERMEVRNAAAVSIGLAALADAGVEFVLTGDGADELLGGYSYTWPTPEPEWSAKRSELAASMSFSTTALGAALGLTVCSPFLTPSFVDWVLAPGAAPRSVCVGSVFIRGAPDEVPVEATEGKLCLRTAFPDSPSAWRRKDPLQRGSGTFVLDSPAPADNASAIVAATGIAPLSAEHARYIAALAAVFPSGLPHRQRAEPPLPPGFCTHCRYACADPAFCGVCGVCPAWIAAESAGDG